MSSLSKISRSYLCSFKSILSSDNLLAILLCSLRKTWRPFATLSGTDWIFEAILKPDNLWTQEFRKVSIKTFSLKTNNANFCQLSFINETLEYIDHATFKMSWLSLSRLITTRRHYTCGRKRSNKLVLLTDERCSFLRS